MNNLKQWLEIQKRQRLSDFQNLLIKLIKKSNVSHTNVVEWYSELGKMLIKSF